MSAGSTATTVAGDVVGAVTDPIGTLAGVATSATSGVASSILSGFSSTIGADLGRLMLYGLFVLLGAALILAGILQLTKPHVEAAAKDAGEVAKVAAVAA